MNRLVLILALALTIQSTVLAQFGEPCLPDGITFSTQAEIDNFQTNYPNCTEIEGDVNILGHGISDLLGLDVLVSIGGDLVIDDNGFLTNMTGLDSVTSIGGKLYIRSIHTLTSLAGLEGLTSVGGDFSLIHNEPLASLAALDNLTSIGGDIAITGNDSLTSLAALDNLISIGGDITITGNYSLASCEAVSICNYLSNPTGSVIIYSNATGCNNPTEVADACGITLDCLPFGNYYFFTQTEIDNFQTNYPNCTEIKGDVTITGGDITNLNGLSTLTSIEGSFFIRGTSPLTELIGLDHLTTIGGNLVIDRNWNLESLTGLDNLVSVAGDLSIGTSSVPGGVSIGNPALTSLTGLNSLVSIGGNFLVTKNQVLINLAGLDNLTSTGGNFSVRNNMFMESLTGLESLTSVGGVLDILYNSYLTSLSGLEGLSSIAGDLLVRQNHSLTSLTGLDNIDAGSIINLYIQNNNSLASCEAESICNYLADPSGIVIITNNAPGCNNPPEVANTCGITLPCLPYGNYYFYTQSQIDNFSNDYPDCVALEGDVFIGNYNYPESDIHDLYGLTSVISIGGDLTIRHNDSLASLAGLDNVITIGGDFKVEHNVELISMMSQNNLTSVEGDLMIGYNNDALTSLTGLENLTIIEGSLSVWGNGQLTNLSGLDNLTSIGTDFEIGGNDALLSLTGLENLTTIEGSLGIWGNDQLTNLSGLGNLTSVGGILDIAYNDSLLSLAGLDSINASSISDLYIHHNPDLSMCAAQSICNYLLSPNGDVSIHNNAPGCNSPEEVELACTVSIDDVILTDKLFIYPNPSSTQVTIELLKMPQKDASLTIYNMNAQQLLSTKITEQKTVLDISHLPNGFYFLKVVDDRKVAAGKLVKK